MKYICYIILTIIINSSVVYAQPFRLFAVSDLVRVFEDGYNLPAMTDTLSIFGIRGEVVSGQVVLSSNKNLKNVSVDVSALKDKVAGTSILRKAVEWNFVGSVPLTQNASNQPQNVIVRPAPALFPDYLMPDQQIDVKRGMYKSVWVTVSIPAEAAPGNYLGNITVRSDETEQTLPFSLTVYPLSLPVERHLKVAEWYDTQNFEKFHGINEKYSEEWFNMLRKYANNMVTHRQNVFRLSMGYVDIFQTSTGEFSFDFSRFDQIAQVFWNTGKMDYLETGFMAHRDGNWFSTNYLLNNYRVKNTETGKQLTIEGKAILPYFLPAFESHLRTKGWLDKTLFHICDEPTLRNILSWREVSSYCHRYAPDLRRIDAIESTNLFDDIEVAVPKLNHLGAWYDEYRKAITQGTEVWFYTVGVYQADSYPNKTIDLPLMDSRILHWLNYKYDTKGYLHWGWNRWTENPFTDVSKHIGDGWHVYPAKDGVLNSLRWEQMRNGLQDYEYFWMLEDQIKTLKDSLGSRFGWINPAIRGKEIVGVVVKDFTTYVKKSDVFYQAKKEVIKELTEFNTSPRIYLQTNPKVSQIIKEQSVWVELLGWTEPGTKIIANGEEIPVNEQGMFLWNSKIDTNNNRITVQASNGNGSKKIVRDFSIGISNK